MDTTDANDAKPAGLCDPMDADAMRIADPALSRLRGANPVRAIGQRAMSGEAITKDEARLLIGQLRLLGDTRWRERVVAIWALGARDLDAESRSLANGTIARLTADDLRIPEVRAGTRLARIGLRIAVIVSVASLAERLLLALQPEDGWTVDIWSALFMVGMLATIFAVCMTPVVSVFSDANKNDRAREMGAWYLGRWAAVGETSALCRVARLSVGPGGTRPIDGLIRLLRRTGMTADRLDPKLRGDVTRALLGDLTAFRLQPSVVEALRDVGDESAIRTLRRLAGQRLQNDPRRASMLAAIEAIEERARRAAAPRELLRASDSVGRQDTLLRAATANVETAPELLLRPSTSNEG